jgi:hypothetical protein
MKIKLLSFLIPLGLVATTLSALAQAKVGFVNDSQHYFVLGSTHPLDTGLGGGGASGSVGAIPASPLPSGYTLIAALYGGTNSDSLSLKDQVPLTSGPPGWKGAGLMYFQNLVLNDMPADCTTSYWTVVVADYINANLLQTEAFSHYFGSSPEFTMVMCGGTISYPTILPGSFWQSTWAPGNVVINYITNSAPFIFAQPQSLSVYVGSNATLNVSASSSQPLTYQWRKGGVEISGATKSALDFMGIALSDAGNYGVVCSNTNGTTVSSNAVLQVLPFGAPSIRVNGKLAVGTVQAMNPATVTISGGFTNGILFYTLDGSAPTTGSPVYSGPFTLTTNATVRAMSLSADFTQTSVAPAVTVLVAPVYSLQTTVNGNGTITVSPPSSPYPSNTVVTLTATAATNWAFDHWTGDLSGTNNPTTLVMNGPRSVGAVFVPKIYPLTVSSPGGGSVTANGQTISSNTFYPSGSVVTLAANASNGWNFIQWQGTATGTTNPLNLVMNQTNDVQALFGTVVTTIIGGRGSITMSQPNPVAFATALNLTAVPAPGSHFVAWSGAASGTDNPTLLTVTNANPMVGAFFGGAPALTIKRTATNTVIVSWPSPSTGWSLLVNTNPATANWATPSETIYDNGTLKYIIVNPPTGNQFYGLTHQ